MGVLFRYAFLLALGLASLFTFVNATAVTGERLAAAGGYTVQDPADGSFMVLALIGVLGFLWLVHFILRGFPALVRNWCERRRGQLGTLVMAGALCMVFLVL